MKKLLVLALSVAVGCTAQKAPVAQTEGPGVQAPAEYVVIARFTVDADPGRGIFSIRTEPTEAGIALGMAGLVLDTAETTVTQTRSWTDEDGSLHRPCADGRTWGLDVAITNNTAASPPTGLSGVFAEITWLNGAGGSLLACNGSQVPSGISDLYGAWSYGYLPTTGVGPVTMSWAFSWVNNTPFTFGGDIVAARLVAVSAPVEATGASPIAKISGETMVSGTATGHISRWTAAGATGTQVTTLGSTGTAPVIDAISVAGGKIWFTQGERGVPGNFRAGWVAADFAQDAFLNTSQVTGGLGDADCFSIVGDPGGAFAWFACSDSSLSNVYQVSGDGAAPINIAFPVVASPDRMVVDGTNVYLSYESAGKIRAYAKADGTLVWTWDGTGGNCDHPFNMVLGADGVIYFTANRASSPNYICHLATDGVTFGQSVSFSNPSGSIIPLFQDPVGNLVFALPGGASPWAVVRVKGDNLSPRNPTLMWTLGTDMQPAFGASSDTRIWITTPAGSGMATFTP